jgi:hypothetical protein
MSDRVKGALLGLGLGVAPLLLLDLALQLRQAAAGEPGSTTEWWALVVFGLVGVVVAVGVALGRKERLAPVVAAVVVGLAVLPALPGDVFGWLPRLPVVTDVAGGTSSAVLLTFGAYVYAAVRGGKA